MEIKIFEKTTNFDFEKLEKRKSNYFYGFGELVRFISEHAFFIFSNCN